MSMLLNRKYGSRLECLFYILQSLYAKYGTTNSFGLPNIKFDNDDKFNVHRFCNKLTTCVGMNCCPYLINPLNRSKCYATQSVESDTTKSKAVSDVGGSLEALGFITRERRNMFKISKNGELWLNTSFGTKQWQEQALNGVLSYGPIIGLLHKILSEPEIFSCAGLYVGYPRTEEKVVYEGRTIYLSTDSQRDSNTRTLSRLIGWCVAVGIIEPEIVETNDSPVAYIKYKQFLDAPELTIRRFRKTDIFKSIWGKDILVKNPLSFSRLHKNVGSLRENNIETLRQLTMQYNDRILNRRFVFVYALNYCKENNKALNIHKLIEIMLQNADLFFIPGNHPFSTMESESAIADLVGIPFEITQDGSLLPLTKLDVSVLEEDAPDNIVKLTRQIVSQI